MKKLKILVVGGGGREHALAKKFAESPLVNEVFCAPGNAGTSTCGTNVDISANDIQALIAFAKKERVDLTVIGPEEPLVNGIVDEFKENRLKIFGPDSKAAQLEGSKIFMKDLLDKYEIPTAKYKRFNNVALATNFILEQEFPLVIKADGLAAGKGVYICNNLNEALKALCDLMVDEKFGDAGKSIVVEEFLKGEEASCIFLVDVNGNTLPLASSQDHKTVGDGDTGPNTGGMGAYSPALVITKEVEEKILNDIIHPTIKAMASEGRPYTGFLYAGLMIDADGNPRVLEFNVRMGDPETQPIMMRMNNDLVRILLKALHGKLDQCSINWTPYVSVCVVMAAKGYPGPYKKGFMIKGFFEAEKEGATVYHAGTTRDPLNRILSSGGRVLGVTTLGTTHLEAQQKAYQAVGKIESDDNLFWRKDIAHRAIGR